MRLSVAVRRSPSSFLFNLAARRPARPEFVSHRGPGRQYSPFTPVIPWPRPCLHPMQVSRWFGGTEGGAAPLVTTRKVLIPAASSSLCRLPVLLEVVRVAAVLALPGVPSMQTRRRRCWPAGRPCQPVRPVCVSPSAAEVRCGTAFAPEERDPGEAAWPPLPERIELWLASDRLLDLLQEGRLGQQLCRASPPRHHQQVRSRKMPVVPVPLSNCSRQRTQSCRPEWPRAGSPLMYRLAAGPRAP